MFDPDGIAPKIRALYNTFVNWTVTSADLLLTRVDATISSAVTAANSATTAINAAKDKPPIASGLVGIPTANADIDGLEDVVTEPFIAELTAACTTFDVWVDLVSYTGSGVLTFAAIYQINNSSSRDAQVEIVIDGLSAYLSAADLFKTAATDDGRGIVPVGLVTTGTGPSGVTFDWVKFNTSLVIRAKKTENAAGTVNVGAKIRYQKWS